MHETIILWLVRLIELIAVVMIVAAALVATSRLIWRLIKQQYRLATTDIRLTFGQHLVLALEFMIAADILKTVLTPTLDDLAFLGGIILIRTVLTVSIAYEVRRSSKGIET